MRVEECSVIGGAAVGEPDMANESGELELPQLIGFQPLALLEGPEIGERPLALQALVER
jgi:hypothetical protein